MAGAATLALLTAGSWPCAFADLPDSPISTPHGTIPLPKIESVEEGAFSPFGPPDSLAPPPPARPPLPSVLPFGPGELLEFSVDYGIVNAGGATMEVAEVRRIAGRPCFDIRTEAKSNAVFSKVYKVWDRSQTFLDVQELLPWRYEKHQREGSYHKDMLIKFDRVRNVATYENGEQVRIHPHAQDELSAFYYIRTIPLEIGREILIDSHTHRKNYPLKVIVHRRESVTVPAGTFDCFVIEPVIREGGIFTAKGKLTIWITADERRIPVLLRTKILVGSISASLLKFRLGEPARRMVAAGLN
jgi:hypothetical protein